MIGLYQKPKPSTRTFFESMTKLHKTRLFMFKSGWKLCSSRAEVPKAYEPHEQSWTPVVKNE